MEYIWNGFDADAIKVDLTYSVNELGGISEIRICDNGTGRNQEKQILIETTGYSRNQVFAFQKYIDLFLK